MDLKKDYTSITINLQPDYEGEAIAVLTSSNKNIGNRPSVLYLHGFIDYFFHPHVGQEFNENNFDFYALDLRKYGRSLLAHQHPNYCKNVEEYYEEISIAIQKIKSNSTAVHILAHSTGALIACNYMNNGKNKHLVDSLILNSPFLNFNQSKVLKTFTATLANGISKIFNYAKVTGVIPPVYVQSIHKDYFGQWNFNLDWKPLKGFPAYFKWLKAMLEAQKKLNKSTIKVPVLVMHSSGSLKINKYSKDAQLNDIVLNIEDMKRIGIKLGTNVTLQEIKDAQHDIFLSKDNVREVAFSKMFYWLAKNQ